MEENKKKLMTTLKEFHDKRYKHLLLLPLLIMLLCIAYMIFFYASTGDFMHRDISLTGGTSITIYENMNLDELRIYLSGKVDSFIVREVSDLVTGDQIAVIIETTSDQEITTNVIEDYLGYGLTEKNSSIEFTGSDLSENFLKQLVFALLTAFLFMGWVIFIIFGENRKIKILTGILSIFPTLMFFFFHTSLNVIFTASLLALAINLFFYFKESIPSLAIVVSAFADIFMTLTVFNILGIQMSTSGIVAFLMIIGYSVDTDILLTNRVIKGHEDQLNSRLLSAFKTGMTMTLTSLLALLAALLVVMNFSDDLTKIFLILVIGLSFDLMNTWITNVSILKWWYLKNKNEI